MAEPTPAAPPPRESPAARGLAGLAARVALDWQRTSTRIVGALLALVLVAVGLLLYDRKLASGIEAQSAALAEQQIHIAQVTALSRDCRKAHVAVLERWLSGHDPHDARGRVVLTMVAKADVAASRFRELPHTSAEEAEVRGRLDVAFEKWAERIQEAVRRGEGPSSLQDLAGLLGRIDLWAEKVGDINSAAGTDAAEDLKAHHARRSAAQLGFAATLLMALVLGVWWRGRVRNETRYLERAKLDQERAASLRAEFFANMSHELRTPLVAIAGFADVIEHAVGTDVETRNAVRQIQRAAKDLLAIINNILDLSKLESGHVEILIEDVALEEVLDRCVMRCQGLVGQKPVELVLEIPPALPPVRGDFVKLQQVFTNLIANAVKFTEKGRVAVRARFEPPGRVIVEVEDSGVGIQPEALQTIWEPFRQADYKVSRRFGGSGLGLAIVAGVVRRLDGTVSVESTVGIGTTFRVVLRAGTTAASTTAPGATAKTSPPHASVGVADSTRRTERAADSG